MSYKQTIQQDVLIKPVISEKSYALADEGKYTFIVKNTANKTQVKIAVESIFDVSVKSVNIITRKGKVTRTRYGFGKKKDTKRAIVTVKPGDTIDIFGSGNSES